MQSLILITLVAASYAFPQGFIADTPEVTAEKARFFQLYNAAAAQSKNNFKHNAVPQSSFNSNTASTSHNSFRSLAPIFTQWKGPVAANVPAGLPGSGNVRNTPEVDAAIAEFNRAYSAALVSTGAAREPRTNLSNNKGSGNQQSNLAHFYQHHPVPVQHQQDTRTPRWTGPLASQVPAGVVGSSGQVADTAEVQAARAAFAQTFNNQLRSVLG